jgi:Na+-driven multidrug efflux pump
LLGVCGFAIIAVQLIGGLFSAAGKHKSVAFDVKQTRILPNSLVLILPNFLGILVWIAFPIADILSTLLTGYFLKKEMNTKLIQTNYGIL